MSRHLYCIYPFSLHCVVSRRSHCNTIPASRSAHLTTRHSVGSRTSCGGRSPTVVDHPNAEEPAPLVCVSFSRQSGRGHRRRVRLARLWPPEARLEVRNGLHRAPATGLEALLPCWLTPACLRGCDARFCFRRPSCPLSLRTMAGLRPGKRDPRACPQSRSLAMDFVTCACLPL